MGDPSYNERGMSEAIAWAVLAPVLLLAVIGLVEAGVWLHARTIVQQAALTAAESQALVGVPAGTADQIVAEIAGELTELRTTTAIDEDSVAVTVRARVPLALDLGFAEVLATATRPRER